MKYKYLLKLFVATFLFSAISCDDFLDKSPDDRTQLNTQKKIQDVLVSAYPSGNYSVLAELSGDNFIDNNYYLYKKTGSTPNIPASKVMHDEIFAWEPAVSGTGQDSPNSVWVTFYSAIAVANHALEAIEKLESEDYPLDLSPQKGEALIIRAYSHFILVNIFSQAYKNDADSEQDLGIPYVTEPESKVSVDYPRGTVAGVYKKIEEDIEEGFKLIDDKAYKENAIKYHFNKKAAAAFASRFYLYKRNYNKVIDYADITLGDNISAGNLRDWTTSYGNMSTFGYDYIDASHECNLLLVTVHTHVDHLFGYRYSHNGEESKGAIDGIGPTWKDSDGYRFPPSFSGKLYSIGDDRGVYFPKYYEMFEYVDRVAGTGYSRGIRTEFTLEETLLCRAEAKVFLNDFDGALKDLNVWNTARLNPKELTESGENGVSWYTPIRTRFVKTLNNEKMSSDFVISDRQLPFIHCILHFRRIENIFDGTRWFDIKRYGIEIEHVIGTEGRTLNLTYNDPRRALQLPPNVISAGMEPNLYAPVDRSNYKIISNE